MKRIEYLPRWYEKSDLETKRIEVENTIEELLNSGKLTIGEQAFLKDINFKLIKDRYSKNYTIKRINELVDFMSHRKGV